MAYRIRLLCRLIQQDIVGSYRRLHESTYFSLITTRTCGPICLETSWTGETRICTRLLVQTEYDLDEIDGYSGSKNRMQRFWKVLETRRLFANEDDLSWRSISSTGSIHLFDLRWTMWENRLLNLSGEIGTLRHNFYVEAHPLRNPGCSRYSGSLWRAFIQTF